MTTATPAVARRVDLPPHLPARWRADWTGLVTRPERVRVGRWRDFSARQVPAPDPRHVWAAATRPAGGPVTGFDRLTHDEGEMRHVWRGHVPVTIASGPDVTRSAAGRLVAELPLVPAGAHSPSLVRRSVDDSEAVASVPCAGRRHELSLLVSPAGERREARLLP